MIFELSKQDNNGKLRLMKYIVSINTKFGSISAESKHPEDLDGSLQILKKLARDLESEKKRKPKSSALRSSEKKQKTIKMKSGASVSSPRKGQGETSLILREIESKLLQTDFFDKPETTGDVKSRLEYVAGRKFTSRKVSQTLGILRDKGTLKRVGKRNYYTYSKQ